jgi:hypothetical protein
MAERSSTAWIWSGFLVSAIALFSYPFFFVRWPITRDFPWANLLLFLVAIAMVAMGLRRALGEPSRRTRILAFFGAVLSAMAFGLFVIVVFIAGKQLPASHGAPQVGQKAPEFVLTDTTGKRVALSELLSTPINGQSPNGVLLVFYRGYW